jgi:pyrimidine-specific ribonucleoside hydrolase
MNDVKHRIMFEMETSDPDDFMTLLWLADHPDVMLVGVLVTPGGRDQCQLVRYALDKCGRPDTKIGALHGEEWWNTQDGQKSRVSGFHYKVYGESIKQWAPGRIHDGPKLLMDACEWFGTDFTVVVGSPPKNLGEAFRRYDHIRIGHWVQQGGFAGDNLVPEEDRLDKFKGRITCPSFNVGGAHKQTLELLSSDRIYKRHFVSKNVCHGVIWDTKLQEQFKKRAIFADDGGAVIQTGPLSFGTERCAISRTLRPGLSTMIHGLDTYLRDKGKAKAMHDLVAAATAIDKDVCHWSPEIEIYREKGEWGARPKENTNTKISIGFDMNRFIETLAQ